MFESCSEQLHPMQPAFRGRSSSKSAVGADAYLKTALAFQEPSYSKIGANGDV
ncbi:hypothetical protein [Choristoneura diversana nucleopolyhedrovirus]|nr:hypothetical protein [Choristoneura diversana nucleopolyhedrovirus]